MSYLVDTNVLPRSAQPSHPMHADAARALGNLLSRGEILHIVPQNIIEYRAVATRPVDANALGMSVTETAAEVAKLKGIFQLLPDTPSIFAGWEVLFGRHAVKGKEAHDARLVAAMLAHKIPNLLTFNTADFKRDTGILAIDPKDV